MAKTDAQTGKRGRKAAIKAAQEARDGAPVAVAEPEPQAPPEPARKPSKHDAIPKNITFFQRMGKFPKDDWGSRVKVKVYRLAPITNQLLGSEHKFCKLYLAYPGPDEEQLKRDCGSGRYRLYLNYKAPAEGEKEIDMVELDIMDMNFPPIIPKGAWLDDPRNKDWEWARKHYEEQEKAATKNGNQTETIMDAIEIVNGLRGQQTDPVKTTLDTIKGVREMMSPQSSPTQELAMLVTVAEKLRPAETVPAFVQAQFAALQAQIAASQERGDKLMMMVIEQKKSNGEGGLSVIKEVVGGLKELLPEVKNLFPFGESEAASRGSRLGPWGELAVQVIPHLTPIVTPFAGVLAQGLMAKMTGSSNGGPQSYPNSQTVPPQHPPQLPGAPAPPMMMPFLQSIAFPMQAHIRFLGPPENADPIEVGKEFALWVYNGYGSNPQYETAITAARAMGPVGIISAFRSTPLWSDKGPQNTLTSLAELEGKLAAFFTAFLGFDPQAEPEEEDAEESESSAPEVLTYSGV